MKLIRLFFAFTLGNVFLLPSAHSFPEMVRYGYVNCSTCHVSLTGGGVLNDYGREIAREKLALFKSDNEKSKEQDFAYGALDGTTISKYLKMGGDVRSVYYILNNNDVKQAQTIFMQGDLEGAFVYGKFTVDGTVGIEQPVPGQDVDFISRRHFVQYAFNDEFNIRVGKYVPAYGIKNPEHIFLTRQPLGFADNFESYNVEGSYITDKWNVFLTGVFGRFDDQEANQDHGFTGQVTFSPTERLKFGYNNWWGWQSSGQSRWVTGGFAMLGLTTKLYASTEFDYYSVEAPGTTTHTNGVATTEKISYEVLEGLWVAYIQNFGKQDFLTPTSQAEDYGVEIQIYPRSHFEFSLAYQRTRQGGGTQDFGDYYWLVSHFYF